jgi:ApaG protein
MFLGFLAMPADQDPRYRISVRAQSVYILEQSQPDKDRYAFAYTITLQNTGQTAARLLDRHWVITDANGRVQEVRGDGVVGEQPHLEPGESFRYTSGTLLETPVGSMHGSYGMIADDGTRFTAPIEPFSLSTPMRLH